MSEQTTKKTSTRATKSASAKRTTTKKASTTKTVQNTEKKEPKKFEPTDLIPCTNIFAGTTVMVGNKTNNVYTWEGIGVTEYVEYQDIRSECLNKRSIYVYEPLIIVEDTDFVDEFPTLKQMYGNITSVEELKDLISNGSEDELRTAIEELPMGYRNSMRNIASTMIQEGDLDSVKKIRIIDELMGTELCEQLGLFIG